MPQAARDFLYLWRGRLFWATPSNHNQQHRHCSGTLLLSLAGAFDVEIDGEWHRRVEGAAIAGNLPFAVAASGPSVVLHLDPDLPEYAALASLLGKESWRPLQGALWQALLPGLARSLTSPLPAAGVDALFGAVLMAVCGYDRPAPKPLDARIAAIVERMRADPEGRVTVVRLAADAGLSESWLMHRFKQDMGLPIRRYALYQKVQRAAMLLASGVSLSEASLGAGFADQAHATRTVRETYGLNPSRFSAATVITVCD